MHSINSDTNKINIMKFKIEKASESWSMPCKNAKLIDGKTEDFEIEIKSLSGLIKLINEVGKVVVTPDNEIIIYDDYLE